MKTLHEHFISMKNQNFGKSDYNPSSNDQNNKSKKGLSSPFPSSSSSSFKASLQTPKSTLSLTPQTPPSPITTHGDGLTPPSPSQTTTQQLQGFTTKNRNRTKKHEQITPPSPTACCIKSQSLQQPQTKRIKIHRQQKSNKRQLYLDFGQSSFGSRTICNICNMLYVHGVKEDEDNHKKVCSDYVHGVTFNMWKHARIVFDCSSASGTKLRIGSDFLCNMPSAKNHGCIIEVKESDSLPLKRKFLQVKDIVDKELGFWNATPSLSSSSSSSPPSSSSSSLCLLDGRTAYLYIENKRILGFCTVESISSAFHLHSCENNDEKDNEESTSNRTTESSKAMLGIHQLWCHRSHRKRHIATLLVNTARAKFVYGFHVPVDMVAFSSPTSEGTRFARKYGNTAKPLVYDCK